MSEAIKYHLAEMNFIFELYHEAQQKKIIPQNCSVSVFIVSHYFAKNYCDEFKKYYNGNAEKPTLEKLISNV